MTGRRQDEIRQRLDHYSIFSDSKSHDYCVDVEWLLAELNALGEALKDCKVIAETATISEPAWVLPNEIAHRVAIALERHPMRQNAAERRDHLFEKMRGRAEEAERERDALREALEEIEPLIDAQFEGHLDRAEYMEKVRKLNAALDITRAALGRHP
jgi:hypothetical protein